MPQETIYTRLYGRCDVRVYMLDAHIMVYQMDGYLPDSEVDRYMTDLLAAAEKHRPRAMIADPRRMGVLSSEFQTAVRTRFWPAIAKLGVQRNPAVNPAAAITQQSVSRMVRTVGETLELPGGDKLDIAVLPTLAECIAWARESS